MKKTLILIFSLIILTFFGSTVHAVDYPGDYTIDTIGDIAGLSGYTGVAGTLMISAHHYSLTDLSGLENITRVVGHLEINSSGGGTLTSLNGLNNLTTVGGTLGLWGNESLTSLNGLENLTYVGGLVIEYNYSLTDLCALYNTEVAGGLNISYNPLLSMDTAYALETWLRMIGFTGIATISGNTGTGLVECGNLCEGDECGRICEGDYTIDSVDTSGDIASVSGCKEITGNLFIGNYFQPIPLTTLFWLESLNTVGGKLYIYSDGSLVSLYGLNNLTSVGGDLEILNTASTSLNDLNNLTSVGGDLKIENNNALTSLNGLENINGYLHGLYIENNFALTSLNGLENLTKVSFLTIKHNASLTSLSGLENITNLAAILTIQFNSSLTDLCALYNISIFGANAEFLRIENNEMLSMDTAQALVNLFKNNGFSGASYVLNNNGSGLISCGEYQGDYTIDDIDTSGDIAGLSGYTGVSGTLRINGTSLYSLTGLENITSVGGGLYIENNLALTSLNGLENITSVGNDLYIRGNTALTSLTGLENITSVGGSLEISYSKVTNLCALYNKNVAGYDLYILGNTLLSTETANALETQLRSNGFTGASDIRYNTGTGLVSCNTSQCAEDDDCSVSSYCFKETCADVLGVCETSPTSCQIINWPVCGCDGITYGNACWAAANKVSVDYEGECEIPCATNSDCDPYYYCKKEACEDTLGTCKSTTEVVCIDIDPVCGCNGITYQTSCDAANEGINVDFTGECFCDSAIEIPPNLSTAIFAQMNTTGSNNDTVPSCGYSTTAPDDMYVFTLDTETMVTATVTGFDTILYLRQICDDPGSELACNDDAPGLSSGSSVSETLPPGEYFLIVDGYASNSGVYELRVDFGGTPPPPPPPCGNDGDGICDDGDNSGTVGDNPCTGGDTTFCDDNCPVNCNSSQLDADGDGIGDVCDETPGCGSGCGQLACEESCGGGGCGS